MDKKTGTIRPNPDLLRRVEALVARTTLSPDEIVNDALRGYLDWQEDFAGKVQAGIVAADQGAFASPREVDRVFEKYRPT